MSIKELKDEELLERLQGLSNSETSFPSAARQYSEEIYSRYFKQVFNFCRYYGLCHNDAEDVAQESFVKFFRNIHSFHIDKKFKPWFFKLVYNKIRDKYQELKKNRFNDLDSVLDMAGNEDENISEKFQIRDYLNGIINELPEKLKTVLVMNTYGELDYEAIAKAVGISSRQVRNRLEQAFELLRRSVEGNDDRKE